MAVIDKEIRRLISAGTSIDDIKDYAIRTQGMTLLRQSAAELVKSGVTTVEEWLKIAYYA
jgi:type IV pilus assembly protein PilB